MPQSATERPPTGEPIGVAMVFGASPLLTVTIEPAGQEAPEIHLHAGGQGVWIARMLQRLGAEVTLCAAFGGETGGVLTGLVRREGVTVREVETGGVNGAYVHDRRDGQRRALADMPAATLSRHEVDELYSAALVEGMDAGVAVLAGPTPRDQLPAAVYGRLARDLSGNGVTVVADLSGDPLQEVVGSGLAVLKVSDEDLAEDGWIDSPSPDAVVEVMHRLSADGATAVIVSRGVDPSLALGDGELVEVVPPSLEEVDHHGAGDSMTAGVAAALLSGRSFADALRLGAAAGTLNVTRRGLATGQEQAVERLARHVTLRPFAPDREG